MWFYECCFIFAFKCELQSSRSNISRLSEVELKVRILPKKIIYDVRIEINSFICRKD